MGNPYKNVWKKNLYSKKWYAVNKGWEKGLAREIPETKKCRRCSEEKSANLFGKELKNKDGLKSYCNPCNAEKSAIYKRANPYQWVVAKFNISIDEYLSLMENQASVCAICKREFTTTPRLDHNHACCPGKKSCGKCIRQFLCVQCNLLLGLIETGQDDLVNNAFQYLKNHEVVA